MHERANRRNQILRHAGALSLLLALGQPAAALAQANEETGTFLRLRESQHRRRRRLASAG